MSSNGKVSTSGAPTPTSTAKTPAKIPIRNTDLYRDSIVTKHFIFSLYVPQQSTGYSPSKVATAGTSIPASCFAQTCQLAPRSRDALFSISFEIPLDLYKDWPLSGSSLVQAVQAVFCPKRSSD